MRMFLVAASFVTSTIFVAGPATAKLAPQSWDYGDHGQARRLQVRIDKLQRQIDHLDSRNILSRREAARLRNESRDLERQLRYASRNGLNGRERHDVERGIQRLEAHIQREARDGNRYNDHGGWSDHDRDGHNDRYEDDRGYPGR